MRRVRLSWCARRTGAENPEDAEIHRVDEQLDRLGAREPASSDDPALRLLGSLAEDVDEDAPPHRTAPKRRLLSKAALTTGLTIVALSGTGAATATVMVGGVSSLQPIHHAVEALYERNEQPEDLRGPGGATASESEDSAGVSAGEVRNALVRARQAMDAGHLGEGRRWLHEARARWSQLGAPSGALEHALSAGEERLQAMQKNARAQGGAPPVGDSSPPAEPSTGADTTTSGATPTDDAPPGGGDDSDGVTPSPTPGDSSSPSASPSPSGPPNGGQSDDTGGTDGGSSNGSGDTDGDPDGAGGQTGGGRPDDTGGAGGQTGGGRPDGDGDTATGRPGNPGQNGHGPSSGAPGAAHGRSEDPPGHRHSHESARDSGPPHSDRPQGGDSRTVEDEGERSSGSPRSSMGGGPPESRDSQGPPWKDG